ncbi:hypothetical protein C8Q72DRAFT_793862 [Fomitopsis betulina]|nr:hypothetical protein C8Q72DRAFT_793862 [Fomitopsis betulina]
MLHSVVLGLAVVLPVASQQIYDIWSTTWQRDNLFTYKNLGSDPISFVTPGSTGTSDIRVDDTAVKYENCCVVALCMYDDKNNGSWDPVDIAATIEFRGKQVWLANFYVSSQARYTFPVGVTTLWWYAAPE